MEHLSPRERIERIRNYAGGLEPHQWTQLEQAIRHQKRQSNRRSVAIVMAFMAFGALWAIYRGFVAFAIGYTLIVLFCIAALTWMMTGNRRRS
jgi:hypothetical protein